MSMSRDRLIREEDPAEVYLRNRGAIHRSDSFTTFRWGSTPLTGTGRVMGLAAVGVNGLESVSGRGTIGRPRIRRGGGIRRSVNTGRENMSPPIGSAIGRARGSSILPSWYPRRPLQDITAIYRVMQALRDTEREEEGHQLESPIAQVQVAAVQRASTYGAQLEHHTPTSGAQLEHDISMYTPTSGAQLEHDISMYTPAPTVAKRRKPLTSRKLPKLLLDISKDTTGDQAFLTPQRKLLNSIEAVEKVMIEDLQQWKNSPAAKKAERQQKVRTLMSMR